MPNSINSGHKFGDRRDIYIPIYDEKRKASVYITSPHNYIEGLNVSWWLGVELGNGSRHLTLYVSKHIVEVSGNIYCGRKTFEFGPCHVGIKGTHIKSFYPEDERINVIATFEGLAEPVKVPTYNDMLMNAPHYPPDTDVVVGELTLKVHRHFLCMISPVFHTYFTNDSKEAQTGELKIDDFEFQTVKNVVDHCQGRDIPDLSLQETFDLLRFADKYDMKSVTKTFEKALENGLNRTSFCVVTQYAWDFDRESVKNKCLNYYKVNSEKLIFTPKFLGMPAAIRDEIMQSVLPAKSA